MKPKKFQRVVEWKEKPDWEGIQFGIFFILVSTVIFCGIYIFPDTSSSVHTIMWFCVLMSAIHFTGWMILINSTGTGKEVYWEEVR